jgi:hypothetical protein
MDTDKETDKDIDTDMDTDLDYLFYIKIWRYNSYRAMWIAYDTSQCKFQQRYKLAVPLPDENYDMLIFKSLWRCWNCFPNNTVY